MGRNDVSRSKACSESRDVANDCRVKPAMQILDATFDDLIPLSVARMPRSWGKYTKALFLVNSKY